MSVLIPILFYNTAGRTLNDEPGSHRIRHESGRKSSKMRSNKGKNSKKSRMLDIDPAFDIIMRVKHREIRSAKFKVSFYIIILIYKNRYKYTK